MKNLKDLYRTEDLYTGYKELDDALDELTEFRVIGKAQRRKIARRMARLVKTSAFKKKVERSKRKIASVAKQKVKAAKLAKQKVLDKQEKDILKKIDAKDKDINVKNILTSVDTNINTINESLKVITKLGFDYYGSEGDTLYFIKEIK